MTTARTILLIDDDPSVLFLLREIVEERGYLALTASTGQEALCRLEEADVVVTDLQLPGLSGLEVVRAAREQDATIPVVVLTAHGGGAQATAAMKAGAYDYLVKPVGLDEVEIVLARALESRELMQTHRRLAIERLLGRPLVTESTAMRALLSAAERAADKDQPLLLRGEAGSGKALIASFIHACGRRAGAPLVRFDCAAVAAPLAESLLFGQRLGDAAAARPGAFVAAAGGTLVLDDVGELPLSTQALLLRVLQAGAIASPRAATVDVRVVAATRRDLLADARAGRFREDLYHRLAAVELSVPSLRERACDIPQLADELARRHGARFGFKHVRVTSELVARLAAAAWPGNVRQLDNTVARLVALSADGVIDGALYDRHAGALSGPSLAEQVSAFERNLVGQALDAACGNQSAAARVLSTRRSTLLDKLKKYALSR